MLTAKRVAYAEKCRCGSNRSSCMPARLGQQVEKRGRGAEKLFSNPPMTRLSLRNCGRVLPHDIAKRCLVRIARRIPPFRASLCPTERRHQPDLELAVSLGTPQRDCSVVQVLDSGPRRTPHQPEPHPWRGDPANVWMPSQPIRAPKIRPLENIPGRVDQLMGPIKAGAAPGVLDWEFRLIHWM